MNTADAKQYAKNNVVHVGDVLGKSQDMYTVHDAKDVLNRLSFVGLLPPERTVSALPEEMKKVVVWFYGTNDATYDLTMKKITLGLTTIAREFDVEHDLVRITRDDLWLRTINGQGTPGRVVSTAGSAQ